MSEFKQPILVTGAHRSGTTWVGKMLTASGEAGYISEPLNILHRPGVFRIPTHYWYTYICTENEDEYLAGLHETVAYRYHLGAEIRSLRSRKDVLRMGRDGSAFLSGRILRRRPLLKDPFAVFSARWFAQRLGCQVVILLRHPAAYVSSLKRLGWNFDFQDLLEQPLLMRDWLNPFRAEIEDCQASAGDLITQGSLLWKCVYSVVEAYQRENPGFILIRHEDLALDPATGFRILYNRLGLQYTNRAQRTIRDSSSSENPQQAPLQLVHTTQLASQSSLENWKNRLTSNEIACISQITGELAERLYPDWQGK